MPWSTILSVILLGVEFWLMNQKNNIEALKNFYAFVHSLDGHIKPVFIGKALLEASGRLHDEIERRRAAGELQVPAVDWKKVRAEKMKKPEAA